MRDNRSDKTIERNLMQKWRFLIKEYELVKAKQHPQFRFLQDFYAFHGTNRQTFAKYYNRFRQAGSADALLPRKRGPKWKSRRTLPYIEQKVLEQRRKGINRYEIYAILKPVLKAHTPSPSTIYAISKRYGLNRLTPAMKQAKRTIIKTRAGELGHLDCHYLSRDLLLNSSQRYYLVCVLDACTRLAWAEVVSDLKSLSVMFAALKSINCSMLSTVSSSKPYSRTTALRWRRAPSRSNTRSSACCWSLASSTATPDPIGPRRTARSNASGGRSMTT